MGGGGGVFIGWPKITIFQDELSTKIQRKPLQRWVFYQLKGSEQNQGLVNFFSYLTMGYHRTKKQCAMCLLQHIIKKKIDDKAAILLRTKSMLNLPFLFYGTPNSNIWIFFLNDLALVLFRPLQFEIIINVINVIWIPMLCVYRHYKYLYSYSAGIDLRRHILTSTDVIFWRIKSMPAL